MDHEFGKEKMPLFTKQTYMRLKMVTGIFQQLFFEVLCFVLSSSLSSWKMHYITMGTRCWPYRHLQKVGVLLQRATYIIPGFVNQFSEVQLSPASDMQALHFPGKSELNFTKCYTSLQFMVRQTHRQTETYHFFYNNLLS